MRLAIISPDLPWPPDNGTRIDVFERTRWFQQQGFKILFLWISAGNPAAPQASSALNLPIVSLRGDFRWQRHPSRALISAVDAQLRDFDPDVLWLEYADFASLVAALSIRPPRVYFRSHNFELAHAWEKSRTQIPAHSCRRLRARVGEAWRIARTERLMHRVADRIFHIGMADWRWMRRMYAPTPPAEWLPPHILRDSSHRIRPQGNPLEIVYLGSSFDHSVELIASRTLIEQIIPSVRVAYPGRMRFHLIGRHGDRIWAAHAADDLRIHGYVPSLEKVLPHMDVACFPVATGWGCKIKAAEMFARGIPVIGHARVFMGFPPLPANMAISCRDPSEFTNALGTLMEPFTRTELASVARDTWEQWVTNAHAGLLAHFDKFRSASASHDG